MRYKGIVVLFLFFLVCFEIHPNSYDLSDDYIVENISEVLIKEYDNYKDRSFIEKTILKLGKPAFIDSVKRWTKNYKSLETMNLMLPHQIENILKIAEKNLSYDEYNEFRKEFISLTFLAYENLQIYYVSVKEYIQKRGDCEITIKVVDEALTDLKYYEKKKELYKEEDRIKNNIRNFFKNKKLKYKLSFYAFAFDFFDKIRIKIIQNDMEKMLNKISIKVE